MYAISFPELRVLTSDTSTGQAALHKIADTPEGVRNEILAWAARLGVKAEFRFDPHLISIKDRLRVGQKIEAIKEYRNLFHTGLVDAKDAVEALQRDMIASGELSAAYAGELK